MGYDVDLAHREAAWNFVYRFQEGTVRNCSLEHRLQWCRHRGTIVDEKQKCPGSFSRKGQQTRAFVFVVSGNEVEMLKQGLNRFNPETAKQPVWGFFVP